MRRVERRIKLWNEVVIHGILNSLIHNKYHDHDG
jgi:hypothetical protein